MGRTKKKVVVEDTLDFESRVEEEIKDKEELKNSKDVLKRDKSEDRKNKRLEQQRKRDKFRKNNVEIQIMCNLTNSTYIYVNPKTGYECKLEHFGQTDFILFEDLFTMARFSRSHLENYWIIITEVLDDELTLEDLIEVLGIQDIYKNEEMMYEDNLDYILKETDLNEFTNIIDNVNENYRNVIMNRAIGLYNASKFNDISRLRILIKDEEALADILEI